MHLHVPELLIINTNTPDGAMRRQKLTEHYNNHNSKSVQSLQFRFLFVVSGESSTRDPNSLKNGETLVVKSNGTAQIVNTKEGYKGLSRKIQEILIFAAHNLRFEYLMKSDDDTIVCVNRVARSRVARRCEV